MKPTVTLHVVASLDGFIARNDNTVSWMDTPADIYENGLTEPTAQAIPIDCYLLGSHTYEHALQLGWPYGDTPVVVTTTRQLPSTRNTVEFYSGDLTHLVHHRLAQRFTNIWLVGGAILAQSFLKLDLVDEIRLIIAPVTLGAGLPLFGNSGDEQRWRLKHVAAYKNNFVDLTYIRPSIPV